MYIYLAWSAGGGQEGKKESVAKLQINYVTDKNVKSVTAFVATGC